LSIANITPSRLSGTITAPPSKSFSHRVIICAALSVRDSKIATIINSDDIKATAEAMREIQSGQNNVVINCKECGSTLRFLIPIVAALGLNAKFIRSESLTRRPVFEYPGIEYIFNKDFSIDISGKLNSGRFSIPGDISSQYISGLLMALPLLNGDSEIELNSRLESSKYIDITIEVMKAFDVHVDKSKNGYLVKGNQKYIPTDYTVEGDWSQAAFFMVAGVLNGDVVIKNLNKNSTQGDKQIFDLIKKFGANIYWQNDDLVVKKSKLQAIETVDASEIPDLVPILAVIAASAGGATKIINARRLKLKECDRLEATYRELKKLGVDIKKTEDSLSITGGGKLNGGEVWSHNDHRIAMALAIMAITLSEELQITGADSVKKSYSHFWEDYNSIGGKADVVNMGE